MASFYSAPCSYYLIYVYEIPGSVDHKGILKVGDTSFKSEKGIASLTPNCPDLKAAAKKRIDQQTGTAGIKYTLHHAELAVRTVQQKTETITTFFRDHDVHDVLEKSGYKHVKIDGATGREWYKADLATIKNAIAAVKAGRISLNSSEMKKPAPFAFRQEQEDAIVKTLNRFKKHNDMLWDAKMRFGKTPTALEVVRRGGFRKTIIVTHRPVVGTSWEEDFQKIFPGNKVPYQYIDKTKVVAKGSEAKEEAAKKDILKKYDRTGKHFIYFASMQDLRGSKRVGGDFPKNDAVFDTAWDLVIVDEAHEGTQTELGKKVTAELLKKNSGTKVLSLSGTPYNLLAGYEEDAVYVWDYTMEQRTKSEWEEKHPGEPNPYAVLPKMNIFTFDLTDELSGYAEEELEGKAFNFTEFFRTWVGDKEIDGKPMPKGVKAGDFVHADDVRKFLDLLSKKSETSRYPFSTPEYCDFFRHTLWMVPGVAAAKALSEMLRNHPVYQYFGIANVAGNGDRYEEEHEDNALELVRSVIKANPRSITLSCGKLTTGVTVPEWTAVLMISGSVHTAAATYMQTIFRVQSPWVHDGQVKEECYVFDFAPDRTLTVLAETAQLSKKISKDTTKEEQGRKALGEFLNFCPVISLECGKARKFEVNEMMRRLKHVFVMRTIRNGFDDPSIYDNSKLMNLGRLDLMKFNDLEGIVGKTKQTESTNEITVNDLGFDQAEFEKRKKEKEKKLKRKLTPEEEEALRKHREELQRARDARSILRAISIRMPMLIYGADVPVDEKITIERFVDMVDEKSWEEFMPKGVTKERFRDFIEYYDRDVFEDAGIQIRRLAKAADKLPPGQRVQQIAQIFGYFKNPDKETVLTPWRVVNMHMSDTLGGWCFFDDKFDPAKPLDDPRFVDRGEVTGKVFDPASKILEINSKSGLYPLYVAYSVYRRKCGEIPESDIAPYAREKKWRETVKNNVFVVCKTPMAASITRRTLVGYSTAAVNTVCFDNLIEMLKDTPDKFIKAIGNGRFWKKEEKEMKFDAVVGNPPYQMMDGGNKNSASPAYHYFFINARKLNADYVSMIMPSRWFAGGKGLDDFRDSMLSDKRIVKLVDFQNAKDCFPTTSIGGGVCYLLRAPAETPTCEVVNVFAGKTTVTHRPLDQFAVFIRYNDAVGIMEKVALAKEESISTLISSRNPFGIATNFVGKETAGATDLTLYSSGERVSYVARKKVDCDEGLVKKWKLLMSRTSSEHAGEPDRNGQYNVLSTTRILKPGEVCSDSYVIGCPSSKRSEVDNFHRYLKTRFVRFIILQGLTSINLPREAYSFVPMQDFSEPWDDAKLYKKYKLTREEIAFIESMIKPME